jgi:cytoskeletal protein CcmA (bactofilin family)
VGTAIIDGAVTGNITASERVVLESDAPVKGQIYTQALSMRLGAILDGDCLLVSAERYAALPHYGPIELQGEDPAPAAELSLVLADEADEELEEFLLSA